MKIIEWIYLRYSNMYWKLIYRSIRSKYKISTTFKFNGKEIQFYGDGLIQAGNNSYIGSYSSIQAHHNCKVVIGEGCMLSHNVRIYTSSLIPDQDLSKLPHLEKIGDVIIGDYVWVGANTLINPGIIIGNNSIIGANSVVTKNIGEFEIVGGVPAKLIRVKKI